MICITIQTCADHLCVYVCMLISKRVYLFDPVGARHSALWADRQLHSGLVFDSLCAKGAFLILGTWDRQQSLSTWDEVVYWGSLRHICRFSLMHVPFSVTNLYICVFSPVLFLWLSFLHLSTNPWWSYICVHLSSPQTTARRPKVSSVLQVTCLIWDFVLLSVNDLCVSLSANTGWSGCEGGLWISVCRRDEQQWTQHTCPNATGCSSYTFTFGETALSWSSSHPRPQQGHMLLAKHTNYKKTQINHCFGYIIEYALLSIHFCIICTVKMSVKVYSCQGHRCCERTYSWLLTCLMIINGFLSF